MCTTPQRSLSVSETKRRYFIITLDDKSTECFRQTRTVKSAANLNDEALGDCKHRLYLAFEKYVDHYNLCLRVLKESPTELTTLSAFESLAGSDGRIDGFTSSSAKDVVCRTRLVSVAYRDENTSMLDISVSSFCFTLPAGPGSSSMRL